VYEDADMSATKPPSAVLVYWNHTLALVNGAPQFAFRASSRSSVVAAVVSWMIVWARQ